VHEVAEHVMADPHVVYVDNDPVVLRHAQSSAGHPADHGRSTGDLTRPDEILGAPGVRRV